MYREPIWSFIRGEERDKAKRRRLHVEDEELEEENRRVKLRVTRPVEDIVEREIGEEQSKDG